MNLKEPFSSVFQKCRAFFRWDDALSFKARQQFSFRPIPQLRLIALLRTGPQIVPRQRIQMTSAWQHEQFLPAPPCRPFARVTDVFVLLAHGWKCLGSTNAHTPSSRSVLLVCRRKESVVRDTGPIEIGSVNRPQVMEDGSTDKVSVKWKFPKFFPTDKRCWASLLENTFTPLELHHQCWSLHCIFNTWLKPG